MNSKLILISLVLTSCSTSTLDTSINNNDSGVEQRTKRDSKNINSNSSNVVVNATAEPVIEVRSGKIADRADPNTLFKNYSIYFDLDEYTVKEDFRPLLKQHAEFLAKNPNEFVFIEGHTDERGGTEYNLALGQRRANAVKNLLVFYGAKEEQMEAYSYGSTKPKAAGSTEEAWSQNRRVDLYYR
jgi:peptidoglycan-associated lipoprotein